MARGQKGQGCAEERKDSKLFRVPKLIIFRRLPNEVTDLALHSMLPWKAAWLRK